MIDNLKIEILSNGQIKFKRGSKEHNKKMREIISFLIDGDDEIIEEINEFFNGSEKVEVLVGDEIFCG